MSPTFGRFHIAWPAVSLVVLVAGPAIVNAQTKVPGSATGKQLYESACVACHAPNGKGQPESVLGFDTPLPDFTNCKLSTVEPDADWASVVRIGGRAHGLDRRMPAFNEVLSSSEIDTVLGYVRSFCTERGWPRGNLNLPRLFFTEKAFPESEAVFTLSTTRHQARDIETEFIYEHRLGRRAQYEVSVPIAMHELNGGGWSRGVGDVSAALKYTVFDDFRRGAIVSAGGEVIGAAADPREPGSDRDTLVETSVMYGQALPSDTFFQSQAGIETSTTGASSKEVFWRFAGGKTYVDPLWGRAWSPMVEVLGAAETGSKAQWDVAPQLQTSLSLVLHVMLGVGVRIPITSRESRSKTAMAYFLWDWVGGGFFAKPRAPSQ